MSLLEVTGVKKIYKARRGGTSVEALKNVNFTVEKGEYVAIMGESGSGKTTLLNILAALDKATAGTVILDGMNLSTIKESAIAEFRRDNLGYVFQDFNLLDTMTARENIALALSVRGEDSAKIDDKIEDIAKLLGIIDVLDKFPYEMSGGQKQRVAAARAVVTDPELVLADEPTGALDSRSSKALMESLGKLNSERNSTILMVTHDTFSASYAGRILFIKDGQIFTEIVKEKNESRKDFFRRIVDVTTVLGGELDEIV